MKNLLAAVWVLGTLAVPASSLEIPPSVHEAVVLELGGRLSEALDRYREALSSDPSLAQDETLDHPLTVYVFSKAAHLAVDLGYGEEAWDLSGRLLGSKNTGAVEAGTLVRMRLARLAGNQSKARTLYDNLIKTGVVPGPGLRAELLKVRLPDHGAASSVSKENGPASQVAAGNWTQLPGPVDVLGIKVLETSRIQVGAFKDWANALTLVEMLREKGWSPLTQVKTVGSGEKLHVVYVISRQPETDRTRLTAQGLPVLP